MALRWYCKFQAWWGRQEGSTILEYVLLGALVAGVVAVAFPGLRAALVAQIGRITGTLNTCGGTSGTGC